MKKLVNIVVPALIAVAVLICVGALWLFFRETFGKPPGGNSAERKPITVYDAAGEVLITTDMAARIYEEDCWAYLEVVLAEAADIIAQQESCDLQQANIRLFTRGYKIYTAFDRTAFEALGAVKSQWGETCNTAGVITDLNGNLLAVYSSDTQGEQTNYARERRSPYSSFKALSVYTPAVEKGIVNWSSMYMDAPYKMIKNEQGVLEDWPANANGKYSNKSISVYEALRKSLNTVAVKCLADVGITEAMTFLQTGFGIPLTQEEYVVEHYGADEVIGNIALGYLETGITPVEMAGYYQIFANGGKYIPPKAISAIKQEDGASYYTRKAETKQIISPATADIMNKLLQGVVLPGGTGEMANSADVQVAGKTGTGDNYGDNWFVGVTPGYSVAMWHGQNESNQAEEMFAAVVGQLYGKLPHANRYFVTHQNLYQMA